MDIQMFTIIQSWDRLIINLGIPILVRRHLYTETVPRYPEYTIFISNVGRFHEAVITNNDQLSPFERKYRYTYHADGDLVGH